MIDNNKLTDNQEYPVYKGVKESFVCENPFGLAGVFEFYYSSYYDSYWLSRYDIKRRKYIGSNLKYYFTDLGLRNARLNFRQQEPTHIVQIFDKDKEGKRAAGLA